MRFHHLLTSLLLAAALPGCSLVKSSPAAPAPSSAAQPGSLTAGPCALAGTKGRTCVTRGNKNVCNVYVGAIGGQTFVFPSELSVSKDEPKTVIVWHMLVPGAGFVRDSDGPLWKGSSSQFDEGGPTDDPDGAHQNKPAAKRFRIVFKNDAGAASHSYSIKYHDSLNNPQQCDPLIVSEAG